MPIAIRLSERVYSGNEHQVIHGIGIVNCIYFNPQNEQLWIIDYRIYDPDTDKKTKIDHVEKMILNTINNKKIPSNRTWKNVSISSPSGEGGGTDEMAVFDEVTADREFPLVLLQAKAGGFFWRLL